MFESAARSLSLSMSTLKIGSVGKIVVSSVKYLLPNTDWEEENSTTVLPFPVCSANVFLVRYIYALADSIYKTFHYNLLLLGDLIGRHIRRIYIFYCGS